MAKRKIKTKKRKPTRSRKLVKKAAAKKSRRKVARKTVKAEKTRRREKTTSVMTARAGVTRAEDTYTAEDITVLEGLDPVRKRPGMYIGGTGIDGLHHLIWEVVDNAIDEAMAGFCAEIEVTLHKDNRVTVFDNGRGIPVEKHKATKKSALETVMCTLHAGAKFEGVGYKVAGGLHGVGVSVVNALSSHLVAEVKRDGFIFTQEYARGKATTKLKKGNRTKETGTTITFEPDPKIFPKIEFSWKKIINHLRQQAYLTKNVRIKIVDERELNGKPKELARDLSFYFDGGIMSYLRHLNGGENVVHETPFYVERELEDVLVETALQYTDEIKGFEISFANNIHTGEGGTHLMGFRSALTRVINDYARKNDYIKEKEENLTGDDVREGLTAIVSVKLRDPQFEGQTKAKLGNTEVRTITQSVMLEAFSSYLEEHPQDARQIMGKCLLAQKARKAAKAAKETVIRKGVMEGLTLPGKLADCSTKDSERSELYIVEGDSAGGSAKQGRDRNFQAIFPLRGKILNIERARLDKILSSKEIKSLIIALGTGVGEEMDISKLRYNRIIIMTDADVDGAHIRTLLLTLFYRYFEKIIENGHLFIAQPPLYRVQVDKEVEYAYTEEDRNEILDNLKTKIKKGAKVTIQRYKGLGEMNPEQLWETTMNPENRVMFKVTVEDAEKADRTFDTLMGAEVEPRRRFIQTHAKSVKNLDI
jgi:DNA gyrase subunit B